VLILYIHNRELHRYLHYYYVGYKNLSSKTVQSKLPSAKAHLYSYFSPYYDMILLSSSLYNIYYYYYYYYFQRGCANDSDCSMVANKKTERETARVSYTHALTGLPSPVGRSSPLPARPPADPFARRQDRRSMASRSATTAAHVAAPPRTRRIRVYIHRRVAHIIPTAADGAKTHEPFRTPYFISCGTHARRDVRAPPAERVEKKNIAKPSAILLLYTILLSHYCAERRRMRIFNRSNFVDVFVIFSNSLHLPFKYKIKYTMHIRQIDTRDFV